MTSKSEQTRENLVETALRLFREKGYEATTMRLIAKEAGTSLGSAYYYFDGKDALVHELYVRIQAEHRDRAEPMLRQGAELADNLRAVLHAGLDTMAPYHPFASTMIHVALVRASSVSPFSPESAPARDAAKSLMTDVLETSRGTSGPFYRSGLPNLLWLAYLGVTLHWTTDNSPQQQKTRELVDGAAPLISRAIALTKLPGGRKLASDAFALADRLTAPADHRSDS